MSSNKKRGLYDNMMSMLKANGVTAEELDKYLDSRKQPPLDCVALEASNLIHGERAAAYGPVSAQFGKIATVASIACGKNITARDIATINIAQKLVRESFKHSRDNLTDIAGYASLKQKVIDAGH